MTASRDGYTGITLMEHLHWVDDDNVVRMRATDEVIGFLMKNLRAEAPGLYRKPWSDPAGDILKWWRRATAHTSEQMTCAYCGRKYPWYDKEYWPSGIYAECWTCALNAIMAPPGNHLLRRPWYRRWFGRG